LQPVVFQEMNYPICNSPRLCFFAQKLQQGECYKTANRESVAEAMEHQIANPPGRLLIVDDDPANRELIRRIVEGEGYEIQTAKDGLDAWGKLIESLPDLIITDLGMPRMSGHELLAFTRKKFPSLCVIVVSGEDDGDDALRAKVLADAYLLKGSFTPNQLRATIKELLAMRSQSNEMSPSYSLPSAISLPRS
jgi:CheY-like chemotaxis protein